jgi:hypothetical protein
MMIGSVALAALWGMISIIVPYRREYRIEQRLATIYCDVEREYHGPKFLPAWISDETRIFHRIEMVGSNEPSDLPREYCLELRKLPYLRRIHANPTGLTDADLEIFKDLKNLEYLWLDNTQTTSEGRDRLRKALPNCEITPAP